jgi:hypothetical protein
MYFFDFKSKTSTCDTVPTAVSRFVLFSVKTSADKSNSDMSYTDGTPTLFTRRTYFFLMVTQCQEGREKSDGHHRNNPHFKTGFPEC